MGPLQYGGAEHMVMLIAGAQAARGHRVRIVSIGAEPKDELTEELAKHGVEFLHIPKTRGFNPLVAFPLRRAIAGFDVIHSYQHYHHYTLLAGASSHRAWVLVLACDLAGRRPRVHEYWAFRLSSRAASRLVFLSEALGKSREFHRAFGSRQFTVIPPPVDVERLLFDESERKRTREELGLDADTPMVLNIARVEPIKAPMRFIEVARELTNMNPPQPVHFIWVGAGSLLERARLVAAELGDRVRFIGSVPRVRGFLSAADALLMTSETEGGPLVALEARVNGLAVLAPELPGLRELAGKAQQLNLYPIDAEPSDIAARIGEVVSTPRGFAPDEYVLKHSSPSAVAEAYERLYPSD